MDLALYLIARVAGIESAIRTARINLVDWHTVGQQPYAQLARSRQSDDALIARCQAWIAEHYPEPAPVAGMVRHSGLAERTFKRRFEQPPGMSPLEYVHTLRLEEAKHLLEAGEKAWTRSPMRWLRGSGFFRPPVQAQGGHHPPPPTGAASAACTGCSRAS